MRIDRPGRTARSILAVLNECAEANCDTPDTVAELARASGVFFKAARGALIDMQLRGMVARDQAGRFYALSRSPASVAAADAKARATLIGVLGWISSRGNSAKFHAHHFLGINSGALVRALPACQGSTKTHCGEGEKEWATRLCPYLPHLTFVFTPPKLLIYPHGSACTYLPQWTEHAQIDVEKPVGKYKRVSKLHKQRKARTCKSCGEPGHDSRTCGGDNQEFGPARMTASGKCLRCEGYPWRRDKPMCKTCKKPFEPERIEVASGLRSSMGAFDDF